MGSLRGELAEAHAELGRAREPIAGLEARLARTPRYPRSRHLARGWPSRGRQFCAIRSYLSTAAKHGLTFFDALVMLTRGQPWMPAI